jgi:hypothetical protein
MQRHVANRKLSMDPSGTSSSPPRGHSPPVFMLMPLPWLRRPFNLIILEISTQKRLIISSGGGFPEFVPGLGAGGMAWHGSQLLTGFFFWSLLLPGS